MEINDIMNTVIRQASQGGELRLAAPNNKPVCYLDVDGVLIMFSERRTIDFYKCHPRGAAARRVEDFIPWLDHNFEVRWLTSWAMSGRMDETDRVMISNILQVDIPTHWDNPMNWGYTHTNVPKDTYVDGLKSDTNKINGIDLTDPRPWVYLDDENFERRFLPKHLQHRMIEVDCSDNKNRLITVAHELFWMIPGLTYPVWADGVMGA